MTLITMRLADMRRVHPGQITGRCGRCGEEVGIYPSGQEAMKKWKDVEIVCQVCRPIDGGEPLVPGAEREAWESEDRNE
jgi:hypothetical protein